jgi:hypothetical protein
MMPQWLSPERVTAVASVVAAVASLAALITLWSRRATRTPDAGTDAPAPRRVVRTANLVRLAVRHYRQSPPSAMVQGVEFVAREFEDRRRLVETHLFALESLLLESQTPGPRDQIKMVLQLKAKLWSLWEAAGDYVAHKKGATALSEARLAEVGQLLGYSKGPAGEDLQQEVDSRLDLICAPGKAKGETGPAVRPGAAAEKRA